MNIRSIVILAATMLVLTASSGAAQNKPDAVLFDTASLSGALDRAWQPLDESQSLERERQTPSLFRDIAGDYGRFFGSRETYVTLGL